MRETSRLGSGGLDGATLERMERLARGLPGHVIAAVAPQDDEDDEARLSVDGVDASALAGSIPEVELGA